MTKDVAASVHQRLLNCARGKRRPFNEAIQIVAAFLQPVLQALSEGQPFDQYWHPGGPWLPSHVWGGST